MSLRGAVIEQQPHVSGQLGSVERVGHDAVMRSLKRSSISFAICPTYTHGLSETVLGRTSRSRIT
jgi:hypothetical protein